jgi:hypothetical protein
VRSLLIVLAAENAKAALLPGKIDRGLMLDPFGNRLFVMGPLRPHHAASPAA